MFELLRMVKFLKAYKAKELRLIGPLVEETIRTLLRKTAKKAAREDVNERSVKKFSNVPSLFHLALLRKDIQEILEKFSHIGFEYNEYLCLVLFVIHAESNCQIGALVDLDYASYAQMKQSKAKQLLTTKLGRNFRMSGNFEVKPRDLWTNCLPCFMTNSTRSLSELSPLLQTRGCHANQRTSRRHLRSSLQLLKSPEPRQGAKSVGFLQGKRELLPSRGEPSKALSDEYRSLRGHS